MNIHCFYYYFVFCNSLIRYTKQPKILTLNYYNAFCVQNDNTKETYAHIKHTSAYLYNTLCICIYMYVRINAYESSKHIIIIRILILVYVCNLPKPIIFPPPFSHRLPKTPCFFHCSACSFGFSSIFFLIINYTQFIIIHPNQRPSPRLCPPINVIGVAYTNIIW